MKNLLRVIIFLVSGSLFSACVQTVTATPSPFPSPTTPPTATFTPILSPTAAATIEPTPMSEYVPPTLIPTIDPTLLPELLSKAFSIQTVEGVNRHKIKQITGWDHGFGAGMWQYSCPGYYWLDKNHLLLYPQAGQRQQALVTDAELTIGIAPQSAIINIDNGVTWLPPVSAEAMSVICDRVYWSPELGILINAELHNDTAAVSTYTYDGYKLASYPGGLADVSPSGTKILIGENTLIDLRTNKAIKLAWNLENYHEPILSDLYWTYPDETRVYRCCYFYADLNTGISHRFKRSDFQDAHGIHLDEAGLWFHQGEWVRDNKYFLVDWLAVDDGPVRYQPLFDPATKLFYDLWKLAGISPDLTWRYNEVSPDGNYVWIVGFEGSYLVNLITFESQHYPYQDPYTYADVNWSADSKFVWSQTYTSDDKPTKFQILSILDRKLNPLSVTPLPDSDHWWHPTKAILVYPAADKNALIFLDTSTMSYQELPFNLYKLPSAYGNVVYGKVVWSPTGEKLALVAEDGSLWQVDYPALENLEQLTPPFANVSDVNWSHDGGSIAFISGSDIYIVEINK